LPMLCNSKKPIKGKAKMKRAIMDTVSNIVYKCAAKILKIQ